MTNEQRESIDYLKESVLIYKNTIPKISDAIDTALSLIKEQQEEIQKKDKQIDLMAEKLAKAYHYKMNECSLKKKELNNIDCNKYKDCTSCIKQYFADKVNSFRRNRQSNRYKRKSR